MCDRCDGFGNIPMMFCGIFVDVGGVSVGMYLALATGHGDVNETAGVENTLVSAALGVLLLLLGLDLYSNGLLG